MDKEVRNKTVEDNLGLVSYVAKKYLVNTEVSYNELFQIGCIGLISAAETFKEDKGTKFSTYAAACIHNQIRMSLRSEKKKRKLTYSLDTILVDTGEDTPLTVQDILPDPRDLFEPINNSDMYEQLHEAVGELTDRQQTIIRARYLEDCPVLQKELCEIFGLSQAQISRIESKALKELKRIMEQRYKGVNRDCENWF